MRSSIDKAVSYAIGQELKGVTIIPVVVTPLSFGEVLDYLQECWGKIGHRKVGNRHQLWKINEDDLLSIDWTIEITGEV